MAASPRSVIVEARGVTKVYGAGPLSVRALDGVDLVIERGDFIAIVGPSGSGKTTLLNVIGALDKPTSGEVYLDGVNTAALRERDLYRVRREKVGFVFQSFYLIPTLSALDNVLVPAMPLRMDGKVRDLARELLALVGLAGKEHRKPRELSGGEQQRVAIARALILRPPMILADEPLGNLDSQTGQEVINLLRRLNQEEGKAIVVVTHNLQLASQARRVLHIRDGRLEGDGL